MNNESILESRKYYKRNKMLSVIRFQKDVSRYDVKKYTSYSMTTVLSTIDEMLQQGMIYEEECGEARVGRKPVWLRINPEGGYFVGLEFNGRLLHCVMLDFTGKVIHSKETPMNGEDSKEIILKKLKDNIRQAFRLLGDKKDKVVGLGIGVPGYINKKEGMAIQYTHLQEWRNIPLKKLMEEEFHIPCYIENNVNVMALAYKWLVYNGSCEDLLFISVRTGARVVPIINNTFVSSDFGFSGELGHVKVGTKRHMCSCGKFGCLNSEISDFAIPNKIREGIRLGRFQEIYEMVGGDLDKITISTFTDSVLKGHRDSLELMKITAEYLGETLSMLINIFAPRRIVLYGELSRIGEPFLGELRNVVKESIIEENYVHLEIIASTFGPDLGAVGAAALVMQEEFDFIEQTI